MSSTQGAAPSGRSRLGAARPAVRQSLNARLMISGASGSGKTRTSLMIAASLAEDDGRVLCVDTEVDSALTYADDFDFDHIRWEPPYDPRDLAVTLDEAGASHDVVIVDSTSHFWRAEGGVLSIADGRFTGWKDARPAHQQLVDSIVRCDAHVILCARSKMEHVQEQDGGKWVVRKIGMKPIQDDELEYELQVSMVMDQSHRLAVSKSRVLSVPVGHEYPAGRAFEFADTYGAWLKGGQPIVDRETADGWRDRIGAVSDADARKALKEEFLSRFGRPHLVEAERSVEVEAWLGARVDGDDGEDEA